MQSQMTTISNDNLLKDSFYCFGLLNMGLHLLRPMRDGIGLMMGIETLPWFFSLTFIISLLISFFSSLFLKKTYSKKYLIFSSVFVIISLLLFFSSFSVFGLNNIWLGQSFFIWISVINVWLVSFSWSLFVELFSSEKILKYFAAIALAGNAGSTLGYIFSLIFEKYFILDYALLLAFFLILLAFRKKLILHQYQFISNQDKVSHYKIKYQFSKNSKPIPKTDFWYLSKLILGYTLVSTFLYFSQAYLIAFDGNVSFFSQFALYGLISNFLIFIFQAIASGFILPKIDLKTSLAILPTLMLLGFLTFSYFYQFFDCLTQNRKSGYFTPRT